MSAAHARPRHASTVDRQAPPPKQRALTVALSVLFVATGLAHAQPSTPAKGLAPGVPFFSKQFLPSTIGPGSVSTLEFTIDNSDSGTPVSNLAFTDTLPAGVTIASPAKASTTCSGGTVSAPSGGTTITFSNGTLGIFSTCRVVVDVTSSTSGTHTNVSGALTSSAGNSGSAVADLTVATDRPGFTKGFSPSSVSFGGRSTLTFTIDNTANATDVFNLDFTDNLPTGMVVANPSNAATDCVATPPGSTTLTATPGSSVVTLNADGVNLPPSIVLPVVAAGASCTVTVDVIGGAVGQLGNTSGELIAVVGTTSRSSGKAGAVLTVTGGASEPILLTKEFTDDPVPPGGTVTLRFTVTNTSRTDPATGIAFTDNLAAALAGLAATGLPASNVCGAGSSISGTTTLSFTGGNLAAESSCTFSVTLQVPAGATPGTYTNTTSTIAATVGGSPVTGSAASDLLFVEAFPLLTKSFTDDPVAAGGTVTLEFTITNTSTASALGNISFIDELTTFLSFPVSVGLPPVPNPPCGGGSALALVPVGIDRQGLSLTGGSLAAAGSPGDSCTFSATIDIPVAFPGGTYTNTSEPITGELTALGNQPVTGPPASDDLVVLGAPRLTKEFTDDPTAPGGTATLEFTLSHDPFAPGDATAIAFTDDLNATLTGLVSTSGTLTNVCGTGSQITGTTPLSFTGGTLAPGASCTFSVTVAVPAGALPGAYTNTTSNVTATVAGESVTGSPAQDALRVAGLTLIKEFTDDPTIPGDTVNLRFTLDNTAGVADATAIFFTDDLDAALTGLAAVAPLPVAPCGGTLAGTTTLVFTGGSVMAGASCFFDVTVLVPLASPDGLYLNVTSNLTATIGGTPGFVLDPATDVLSVDSSLLAITKSFTDDPALPGGTVTLEFTITNLDATRAASSIAFTDDLAAALAGLSSTSGTLMGVCGAGSSISGTTLLTFAGGSLPAGGSCTFSVTLAVPAGPLPGSTFTNTTSAVSGTINGFAVSGPAASDDLEVVDLLLEKSFGSVAFPGGTVSLTFTLTNLDATGGAASLAFSDSLPGGLVATGLPASGVCGAGSQISGTTFLTFSGGSLGPSGTCSFAVNLQVPAAATPGSIVNTTSALSEAGLTAATPATAALTIEPPPTFTKSFTPPTINLGAVSTLAFTIDNSASTLAATGLAFTDNLPAAVVVANPANASTTCGGTLTATPGTGVVSLSGGSAGAGATCTAQVDVTSSTPGANLNTTGDLTSSSGNSGPASATLTVNTAGPLFTKAFVPAAIPAGATATLVFTMDHSAGTSPAMNLAFTDNLPAAVVVANPANASTTCGGTVTAAPGSGIVSASGGSVGAGATCTVQVDVTSSTPGSHVNITGDLTSSLGSSGTATATLTVEPPPTFSKSFASPTLGLGGVTTLVFTIDNSASSLPASGLAFSDTLPAAISIASPPNASTSCTGGTISAPAGGSVVAYSGGSVGAGAICTVQVDVTSSTPGSHVNTTDDLVSSLGTSPPATATLTVGTLLEIPTADRWALVLLAVLLVGLAVWRLRLAA